MASTVPPHPLAPVLIVGIGELGGVLGRGFLRTGHPVFPWTRAHRPLPPEPPALAMVTVGEGDLESAVAALPDAVRGSIGLVQNELLPSVWRSAGVDDPTVAVIWFEKKAGQAVKVVLPTVIAGRHAALVGAALDALHVPWRAPSSRGLIHELVVKNLYILTLNFAGLAADRASRRTHAGALLSTHRGLFDDLVGEVLTLQRALLGDDATGLDDEALVSGLEEVIRADVDHACAGRSAPSRLRRNLELARQAGLMLPTLENLGKRLERERS